MIKDSHWDETVDRPWIGKAEAFGRGLIYRLAWMFKGKEPKQAFDIQQIRKILLIKEPYRMGDLFQITPTLKALKEWNKDVDLGLLIQDRNLPVFVDNPRINRLHLFRKRELNRRPWKIFSLIKEIRREKYDLAVTLETQRTHLTNDYIALLSGVPYRLRYDGAKFGNPESNGFYNLITSLQANHVHQVDLNFGVFSSFGIPFKDKTLEYIIPEKDNSFAKDKMNDLAIKSPSLCIHPGSFKISNRWPITNYLEVAKDQKENGKSVVFILGPSELGWKNQIEQEGFKVVSGITLPQMAGLFVLSDQVLCNDTGVMHIAGAVGAKTLALFGQTEPEAWKPPGPAVTALRAADHNIASIQVNEVLNSLLGATKKRLDD